MGSEETRSECEQSFPTASDVGGLLLVSEWESAAALDTGATANVVCFRWLEHYNRLLGKEGRQGVPTFS